VFEIEAEVVLKGKAKRIDVAFCVLSSGSLRQIPRICLQLLVVLWLQRSARPVSAMRVCSCLFACIGVYIHAHNPVKTLHLVANRYLFEVYYRYQS
jgi:hypothetical protein